MGLFDAKFVTCSSCGTVNSKKDIRCNNCNKPLGERPQQPAQATPKPTTTKPAASVATPTIQPAQAEIQPVQKFYPGYPSALPTKTAFQARTSWVSRESARAASLKI